MIKKKDCGFDLKGQTEKVEVRFISTNIFPIPYFKLFTAHDAVLMLLKRASLHRNTLLHPEANHRFPIRLA